MDGEILFHGGDICKIMGYARARDAVTTHCKYAKILKSGDSPLMGIPPFGTYFIPESDVHRLVMSIKMLG